MSCSFQSDEFLEKHKIKERLKNSFSCLIEINSATDLDIDDKNITIDLDSIIYKLTELNFHSFQAPITKNKNKIGYYMLIFTDTAELIDELFVIADAN